METKSQSRSFWSFVVTKREVSVRGQEPNVVPVLLVEGYFIFCTHVVTGTNEEIVPYPLTPLGKTVQLEIPPWFFNKKDIENITAGDITNQFAELLKNPFEIVGPPPLDIPIKNVPPSRRKTVVAAAEQARKKGMRVPPPGGA
jgi:hypothetical protein